MAIDDFLEPCVRDSTNDGCNLVEDLNNCSVSTKLATFPWLSTPLVRYRVPGGDCHFQVQVPRVL